MKSTPVATLSADSVLVVVVVVVVEFSCLFSCHCVIVENEKALERRLNDWMTV